MTSRNSITASLASTTAFLIIQAMSIALKPLPIKAAGIVIGKCPTSGSVSDATFKATVDGSTNAKAACYFAASSYQISIYEIGLCASNPISSSGLTTTNCKVIYSNPGTSEYTEIANTTVDLSAHYISSSDSTKYSYAYALINPTLKAYGTYSTTNNTYYPGTGNYTAGASCTTCGVNTTTSSPGSTISYDVASGVSTSCYDTSLAYDSYTLSYAFVDSSKNVASLSGSTCTGYTQIAISSVLPTQLSASDAIGWQINVSSFGMIAQSFNSGYSTRATPGMMIGIPLFTFVKR